VIEKGRSFSIKLRGDFMPEKISKYVYHIYDIPLTPLTEKVGTRFLAGTHVLLSFIEQPPGATFPLHRHPSEQILIILEGSEEHIIDGETILMKAGDVCIHPPNVEHGGRTPTGFKGIDIFSPPREDYLELMRKHKKEK
jgi:quercetin dioxygenase-like cupin family protein